MIDYIKQAPLADAQRLSSPVSVDPQWSMRNAHADSRLNAMNVQGAAETREQLIQAGQEFEAYFVSYLLKVMRETVPEGALANKQGAYFHSFYDEEIGRRAAQSGGIGIAKMVEDYAKIHLSVLPEKRSSSATEGPIRDASGVKATVD